MGPLRPQVKPGEWTKPDKRKTEKPKKQKTYSSQDSSVFTKTQESWDEQVFWFIVFLVFQFSACQEQTAKRKNKSKNLFVPGLFSVDQNSRVFARIGFLRFWSFGFSVFGLSGVGAVVEPTRQQKRRCDDLLGDTRLDYCQVQQNVQATSCASMPHYTTQRRVEACKTDTSSREILPCVANVFARSASESCW